MNAQPQLPLEVGRVARDTRTRRLGVVLAVENRTVRLQAIPSGRVWETHVSRARRVSAREELKVRVAAANARAYHER
ncbi:hypothetical protein [Streptomyces sp. CA-111067]|jgi:hypothetical protein|uniref:hypothetical protein n=1 Tax=Streptomyces sp. CA-111067 TaxID=3240046 RepID=UPI003D97F153